MRAFLETQISTHDYLSDLQLKLDEANCEFDKVFELRPNAYLWQAGIGMCLFENVVWSR